MTNKDKKLLEQCCKITLLDMIKDSKLIHERLSLKEYNGMGLWIHQMTYNETISVVFNNGVMLSEIGIRDFQSKFKILMKYGLAMVAGGFMATGALATMFTGPVIGALLLFLFRKATDPCWKKCVKHFGRSEVRKVCKHDCQAKAAEKIVTNVKGEISKCSNTKNPIKCQKKLNKEYIRWSQRLQKELVLSQQAKAELGTKMGRRRQ